MICFFVFHFSISIHFFLKQKNPPKSKIPLSELFEFLTTKIPKLPFFTPPPVQKEDTLFSTKTAVHGRGVAWSCGRHRVPWGVSARFGAVGCVAVWVAVRGEMVTSPPKSPQGLLLPLACWMGKVQKPRPPKARKGYGNLAPPKCVSTTLTSMPQRASALR